MLNCPKCGSPRIHRSKTRTVWERVHKGFTNRRLHRCHACGWRGWGPMSAISAHADCTVDNSRPAPDLQAIDVAVGRVHTHDGR